MGFRETPASSRVPLSAAVLHVATGEGHAFSAGFRRIQIKKRRGDVARVSLPYTIYYAKERARTRTRHARVDGPPKETIVWPRLFGAQNICAPALFGRRFPTKKKFVFKTIFITCVLPRAGPGKTSSACTCSVPKKKIILLLRTRVQVCPAYGYYVLLLYV